MNTKYPIKVGQTLYPPNTEVRQATLAEMQQVWPGIKMRRGSPQVGVWFPDMQVPTIVHMSQLDGVKFPISTWNTPADTEATVRCGPGPS